MSIDFVKLEEETLEFWNKEKIFERSLELNKAKPKFTFYDGPPFATGLPHYGHLLAGTIKDVVTRFAHQRGHYVERRFGWDCHGLPVEYEIDQTHNIKGPEDVEKMGGIEAYNRECRKIVTRYSGEWEKIVKRTGRWVDFKNGYKTMDPQFMESVWSVFKQLFNKKLVYKGFKVMPYSTACGTPLSNFESGQNYKEVSDPSVIIAFPVLVDGKPSNRNLLVWTTTPWTLPSNLALCVNADFDYVEVEEIKTNIVYICLESRLEFVFKKNYQTSIKILKKYKGSELENLEYEPLFNYFAYFKEKSGAFRVVSDGYVSSESGTGIVHQAPYFGEDDNRVCLANKIIVKDGEIVCPLDSKGRFVEPVRDFLGLYVKDADKAICKMLKQKGRLYKEATVNHSYPFCWRSDTPLIYRAVSSWFIEVEQLRDRLLGNNSQTYWVPDNVKEKRFANWLKDARDWAVSRNRYWGTPIPIWTSDDQTELVCVGSVEELESLSGVKVEDLHREVVDKITIPSKQGKGLLKRVPEVFDCWFESGSMPYAQQHYLFKDHEAFKKSDNFPADFIAEGIDQTRGWFYTLLVISTALFDKRPFKNLIVNGLVLASDGQKMSKRKKNYPDAVEVINRYGSDALRLYLITSPAVRAENLKFKEEGVKDILKDVVIPWYNAYKFFTQNVDMYKQDNKVETFQISDLEKIQVSNIMDRWIISFTHSLVKFVIEEMDKYHLYKVVPRLVKFVNNLTNWYIRINRQRLKGHGGEEDCKIALTVLFHVLLRMVRVMAPFTPFITELLYRDLKNLLPGNKDAESVHFLSIPEVVEKQIDIAIERKVSSMQRVIELGRVIRDRKTLPLKYPLAKVIVISSDEKVTQDVQELADYVKLELNVEELEATNDKEKFGIKIKAIPDLKLLGARLRGESKSVIAAIQKMSEMDLQDYQNDPEHYQIFGHTLEGGELKLAYSFNNEADGDKSSSGAEQRYEAYSDGNVVVLLDILPDKSMFDKGLAREFINRIQKLRKKAGLVPTDLIDVEYYIENENVQEREDLHRVIVENEQSIGTVIKSSITRLLSKPSETKKELEIARDIQPIKNSQLNIVLLKRNK